MCGDPSRYCPEGSAIPRVVPKGFYSMGGNESTRSNVVVSPMGHYARMGVLYTCPAGRFGATEGLDSSFCSGPCDVNGYYCPG
jgi:hypothetical protein